MKELDPQTASDAEIDAWLAKENRTINDGDWHPTSDYSQTIMCENKVRERWWHGCTYLNEEWIASAEHKECDVDEMHRFVNIWHKQELSARARLVVAILQYEKEKR